MEHTECATTRSPLHRLLDILWTALIALLVVVALIHLGHRVLDRPPPPAGCSP